MTAREFYNKRTLEDGLIGSVQLMEEYHKAKVESITDEEIEKHFRVFSGNGKTSDMRKKRAGAKWLKQKLLKNE